MREWTSTFSTNFCWCWCCAMRSLSVSCFFLSLFTLVATFTLFIYFPVLVLRDFSSVVKFPLPSKPFSQSDLDIVFLRQQSQNKSPFLVFFSHYLDKNCVSREFYNSKILFYYKSQTNYTKQQPRRKKIQFSSEKWWTNNYWKKEKEHLKKYRLSSVTKKKSTFGHRSKKKKKYLKFTNAIKRRKTERRRSTLNKGEKKKKKTKNNWKNWKKLCKKFRNTKLFIFFFNFFLLGKVHILFHTHTRTLTACTLARVNPNTQNSYINRHQ